VGFFLERDPWRLVGVLLFHRKDAAAPEQLGPSTYALWGLPLQRTQANNELYAPGMRATLRLVDTSWAPPRAPRVTLPNTVPIKTPTRTFYRDQLFAVQQGRIWFKRDPEVSGAPRPRGRA